MDRLCDGWMTVDGLLDSWKEGRRGKKGVRRVRRGRRGNGGEIMRGCITTIVGGITED